MNGNCRAVREVVVACVINMVAPCATSTQEPALPESRVSIIIHLGSEKGEKVQASLETSWKGVHEGRRDNFSNLFTTQVWVSPANGRNSCRSQQLEKFSRFLEWGKRCIYWRFLVGDAICWLNKSNAWTYAPLQSPSQPYEEKRLKVRNLHGHL